MKYESPGMERMHGFFASLLEPLRRGDRHKKSARQCAQTVARDAELKSFR
jgi:hypothetical protein